MDAAGARENNRDVVLNEWPDLAPLAEHWGKEMAHRFEVGQSVSAHSDHFPFFMAGVPTGGIQSAELSLAGRGWGHTRYDTVDKVELDDLREASALAARLLLRMADAEDWPVTRRTEEAVRALLGHPGVSGGRSLPPAARGLLPGTKESGIEPNIGSVL